MWSSSIATIITIRQTEQTFSGSSVRLKLIVQRNKNRRWEHHVYCMGVPRFAAISALFCTTAFGGIDDDAHRFTVLRLGWYWTWSDYAANHLSVRNLMYEYDERLWELESIECAWASSELSPDMKLPLTACVSGSPQREYLTRAPFFNAAWKGYGQNR